LPTVRWSGTGLRASKTGGPFDQNSVWEGAVDAWTEQIIGDGTTTPVSKLDDEDKLELAGLQKASIDLATATALAEEKGSGKAISAGLEETNGRIVYQVAIVSKGATLSSSLIPRVAESNKAIRSLSPDAGQFMPSCW
jgi:hypothetical protein